MLRWAIRSVAASRYKNQAIKESNNATRKAKDAMTKFRYAKSERDDTKKYLVEVDRQKLVSELIETKNWKELENA